MQFPVPSRPPSYRPGLSHTCPRDAQTAKPSSLQHHQDLPLPAANVALGTNAGSLWNHPGASFSSNATVVLLEEALPRALWRGRCSTLHKSPSTSRSGAWVTMLRGLASSASSHHWAQYTQPEVVSLSQPQSSGSLASDWCRSEHVTQFWPMRYEGRSAQEVLGKDSLLLPERRP